MSCNYLLFNSGERYLRQMLSDAMQIANCATNPEDKEAIKKAVSDIQAMTDALTELKAQGKVIIKLSFGLCS